MHRRGKPLHRGRPSNRRLSRKRLLQKVAELPETLEPIPADDLEQIQLPRYLVAAWRSRHFIVQHYREPNGERISIQRTVDSWRLITPGPRKPITWDELQQLKREAGFAHRWACELFPPDDSVIDVAHMRHLWLLAEDPGIGWARDEETPPSPAPQETEP